MKKLTAIIFAAALLVLALASCGIVKDPPETAPDTTASVPQTTDITQTTVPPDTTAAPETSAAPETAAPDTAAPETTAPDTAEPYAPTGYDFSAPVPESASVGKDYFDDAVFLGNSRTRGFLTLAGLAKPDAYAFVGLTVSTVFTEQAVPSGDSKITVVEALHEKSDWTKAYIMFGTNEIGWTNDAFFISKYGALIDELRAINPDVKIYMQSVLPVGSMYTPDHPDYYMYNMPKINKYNGLLRELAKEKEVYFVDVASVMTDENGFLFDDASNDGVHLKREYCMRWLEYLMCHTAEESK